MAFFDKKMVVYVSSKELLPENKTIYKKVVRDGAPFYWTGFVWIRDYQARKGEYDSAPIVSDPDYFGWHGTS
jgi:hypothetical protein